jgi:NAD(P)-dependent dehydrogenase (short-subunit alcohol dehydrogenase family)
VTLVGFVTGAASGNGRAIVGRLLRDGASVAAVDVDPAALERTRAEDWADAGERVLCVGGDVADPADVDRAFAAALERFGRLDLLVNNAGINGGPEARGLLETPLAAFDRVWGVNVRGAFLCCRAALPTMLAQGAGVIVNIASVAGLVAFPGRSAYSISKGAMIQLTRSVAVDYGGRGIRCNALCPGMIDTPMTHWRLSQPAMRAEVLARIPQQEIGDAADVAGAVSFLAGPDARYFNGAALVMDGAYSAV